MKEQKTSRLYSVIGAIALIIISLGIFYCGKGKTDKVSWGAPIDKGDLVGAWSLPIENPYGPECTNVPTDQFCIPHDSMEMNFSLAKGVGTFNSYIHFRPEELDCSWDVVTNI